MELSGNLGDMVVQVTASGANKFDGTHGDGTLTFGYTNILTRDGNADNSTWPGYGTYGVTGNGGSMERGSYWKDTSLPDLRVCDRSIVTPSTIPTLGGRCVRTEPH